MNNDTNRRAMSLPEVMATVAILGVLAAMALGRFNSSSDVGKATACHAQQAEIELQAELWHRVHESYPAAGLGTIGSDTNYFPEGVPVCPVDGTTYTIDITTGKVIGHSH